MKSFLLIVNSLNRTCTNKARTLTRPKDLHGTRFFFIELPNGFTDPATAGTRYRPVARRPLTLMPRKLARSLPT